MRLSVIVPVYNMAGEAKLNHCLDSLAAQTLAAEPEGMEVLAVDDCSTDDSLQILRSYERRFPFIRVLRCDRNRHQGGAKNLGLSAARGEWIGFLDADDWVTPDYYSKLLSRADETGADMVGCDYCLTEEFSFRVGRVVHNNRPEQAGRLGPEQYRSLILDSGSLVVKIYRRELILDCESRFPEDMFYEDNALANTWMLRARHFEYLPFPDEMEGRELPCGTAGGARGEATRQEGSQGAGMPAGRADGPQAQEEAPPLYFYYQHADSTVHTVTRKRLLDRMKAGRLMLEEARRYGYFETYRDELEYSFTVLFYVNTLFSAMREMEERGRFRFVTELAMQMRETFPSFEQNRYYLERTGEEERRFIHLQQAHPLRFYCCYRGLWLWRDFRKRLEKRGRT